MSVIISMSSSLSRLAAVCVALAAVGALATTRPVSTSAPALASVVLFALPSFLAVTKTLGARRGLPILAGFGLYALVVESIGIATGFPYGRFAYGDGLGPKLLGLTPLAVAFAWTPILLAGHAVASRLRAWPQALALGIATMVAIDLAVDPGAVHAGYWAWATPGPYYGVPWVNFLGWIVTSLPALAAARRLLPPMSAAPTLTTSAVLTLAFWSGYLLLVGLYAPAIIALTLITVLTARR